MKLNRGSTSRRGITLLFSILSIALLVLVAVGCTVGPIDFTNGTPGPTQPAPGADSTATPQLRPISGLILDADTGKPVEGAEITASGILTATAADGLFYFEDVPAGTKLAIDADGYKGTEVVAGPDQVIPPVKLKSDLLTGVVTDGTTGKPLAGVLVRLTFPAQQPVTVTGTITNGTDLPLDVDPHGNRNINRLDAPEWPCRACSLYQSTHECRGRRCHTNYRSAAYLDISPAHADPEPQPPSPGWRRICSRLHRCQRPVRFQERPSRLRPDIQDGRL